jgi:hypothetical protein
MERAQGQATIKTVVKAFTAKGTSFPTQKTKAATAMVKTVQVNTPLIRLARGSNNFLFSFSNKFVAFLIIIVVISGAHF